MRLILFGVEEQGQYVIGGMTGGGQYSSSF